MPSGVLEAREPCANESCGVYAKTRERRAVRL